MEKNQETKETDRLTTQWLDVINTELPNGDIDRFMALWADDALQTSTRGDQRGTGELRAFFAGFKERNSTVQHKEIGRVVQGNHAALRVDWVGTTLEGKPLRFDISFFLEFDGDGKVKANHVYFDPGVAAKQRE